jgi:hypothetical protein
MKDGILALLLVLTIASAGLYLHQSQRLVAADATIASLQQKVEDLESRLGEQEKRATGLQAHLQNTRETAIAKAEQVTHLEQALTNSVQTNAKSSNPLAEMFRNPEMKTLIKNQQKMALSGMIDKNYTAFFTGMNLTSEQTASFKDFILKKALVDAQAGMSLMSSDLDAEKRTDLLKQAKTEKDAIDEQIKQFLGEDNYPGFKAYEKTIPERMALNGFKEQQASGPGALTGDQESQLLQAITDETHSFKFTTDYTDQSKLLRDPGSFFTDDKLAQFQQEREQLHDRYLERATNILSADQATSFQTFLKGQRDMQDTAMKMASKLFGAAK